jgi:hypothetical protein
MLPVAKTVSRLSAKPRRPKSPNGVNWYTYHLNRRDLTTNSRTQEDKVEPSEK